MAQSEPEKPESTARISAETASHAALQEQLIGSWGMMLLVESFTEIQRKIKIARINCIKKAQIDELKT